MADQRYEFDAPQHYDFQDRSRPSVGSVWFEGRKGSQSALRSPLKEVNTSSTAECPNVEQKEAAGPSQNLDKQGVKRGNIVTSWGSAHGEDNAKKRKAKQGPSGQPQPKAQKDTGSQPAAPARVAAKPAAPAAARAVLMGPAAAAIRRASQSQKERAKALKPGRALLAKVLQSKRMLRPRSTKQLTLPEEFELNTSKRHRSDCLADQAPAASPFKALAVKAKEFESKTPGRFKGKPPPAPASRPASVTQPKEPLLWTTTRTRPSHFKPREKVEEEEMSSMPRFKASTLNPLVLASSGQIGVPCVEKRGPTELQPFQFITDDRAETRAQRMAKHGRECEEDDEHKPRKARKSTLPNDGVPRSPVLMTRLRARESKVEEPNYEFHARPVPNFLSGPSELKPVVEGPAPTETKPFQLRTDQRHAQHQASLQAKLAAGEMEAKAAARRARERAGLLPLSTDVPMIPPKPEARPLTMPEPFGLASEARHGQFVEQRQHELQAEEEAKRAEAHFKARPVWRGIPFRLLESDLPLTIPEDVHMHTSERAAERGTFNKAVEHKWKAIEEEKRQADDAKQRREEAERRKLRKSMVFHARPMPDFSSIPSAPSAKAVPAVKALTKPVSPKLGRTKRGASSGGA